MALLEVDSGTALGNATPLTAAVCGTFHRDTDGLRRVVESLALRFDVLSPARLDFVDPQAPFVRLPSQLSESECDIERRHLEAMREADLVWLHAPEGYVGPSAAMELGHAAALGIPVFTSVRPTDPVMAGLVVEVSSPDEIEATILEAVGRPGSGVDRLQRYYRRTAERRGWAAEGPKDALLLLTEELGELARAIRKFDGLQRHQDDAHVEDIAEELADVQLYVVHLANTLGLDLSDAVTAKEQVNARRFRRSRDAA